MNYAMSQGRIEIYHILKKLSSAPSGKGHTSPGKNVTGKDFLSEYEMPISFQVSGATSQDTFFKIRYFRYDFHNYSILQLKVLCEALPQKLKANSCLGHDKLIFCLADAHASIFNPPHQMLLLENQCMKPFFLSFYKVLT